MTILRWLWKNIHAHLYLPTCDRALKHGVMPLQAETNGLQMSEIPFELPDLAWELNCLCLPFMKMVYSLVIMALMVQHFSAFHCGCSCHFSISNNIDEKSG